MNDLFFFLFYFFVISTLLEWSRSCRTRTRTKRSSKDVLDCAVVPRSWPSSPLLLPTIGQLEFISMTISSQFSPHIIFIINPPCRIKNGTKTVFGALINNNSEFTTRNKNTWINTARELLLKKNLIVSMT